MSLNDAAFEYYAQLKVEKCEYCCKEPPNLCAKFVLFYLLDSNRFGVASSVSYLHLLVLFDAVRNKENVISHKMFERYSTEQSVQNDAKS